MATNFPGSLDSLTNPTGSDALNSPSHSSQHADANDAIEALQAKVGVDGSAVTTSLDYKVAQAATLTDTQTLTNKTLTSPVINTATVNSSIVYNLEEAWRVSNVVVTGALDISANTYSNARLWTSNASGNFTLNFWGDASTTLDSMLDLYDSMTFTLVFKMGATAYYPTAFSIDGVSVTPEWQGGSAPTSGNADSYDAYTFTIIKTAATPTYTVLASQTQFA